MNIIAEKLEIMKLILETNNPLVINSIKKIFEKNKEEDFWESLTASQKEDILAGIEEVENGELINYDEFISKHK